MVVVALVVVVDALVVVVDALVVVVEALAVVVVVTATPMQFPTAQEISVYSRSVAV